MSNGVTHLIFGSHPIALMAVLLVALVLAVEIPYQWGLRNKKLGEIDDDAWGTMQAGLLTLVAFMLGLSYAQAQGRFDSRRALVVTEANAIGTTWLRADQLAASDAARFRGILTDYTRERLEAYSTPARPDIYQRAIRDSDRRQAELWALASQALRAQPANLGRSQLVTALNETIDVSAAQLQELTHHVPTPVLIFTFALAVIGTISIGLRCARRRSRPIMLTTLYVLALVFVMNLIVDYDRPQVGFIHVSLDPLAIQLHSMEH